MFEAYFLFAYYFLGKNILDRPLCQTHEKYMLTFLQCLWYTWMWKDNSWEAPLPTRWAVRSVCKCLDSLSHLTRAGFEPFNIFDLFHLQAVAWLSTSQAAPCVKEITLLSGGYWIGLRGKQNTHEHRTQEEMELYPACALVHQRGGEERKEKSRAGFAPD